MQVEVKDVMTIVDDDDFGFGEQLVREEQKVEEYVEEVKCTESLPALITLQQLAVKDKNRTLMRNLGLIPSVIAILSSVRPPAIDDKQAAALKLFALLCQNIPNREEIRKKGGIDPLIKLIELNAEDKLVDVFQAAYLLADSPNNKTTFKQRGLVEATLPKIKKVGPVVLQPIYNLIALMALNEKKIQDTIVKQGAVSNIIESILQANPGTQFAAVNALGSICSGNRQAQALARKSKPALNAIVQMLSNPVAENRELAATAITAISENDFTNQVTLQKEGVLLHIATILRNPNESFSVREKACAALAALSNGNATIQKEWKDFPLLLQTVYSGNPGTQVQALIAISELTANNSQNCDTLLQAGAIPILIGSLQSETEAVQYRATSALYSLVRGNPTRKTAVKSDSHIVPTLNALKGSGNAKVKQGAEWVLEELTR